MTPQHDWSELSMSCRRCLRPLKDAHYSCMSDDDIARTQRSVSKLLGKAADWRPAYSSPAVRPGWRHVAVEPFNPDTHLAVRVYYRVR